MTGARATASTVRLVLLAGLGLIAVVVLLLSSSGSSGSAIPGMPAAVATTLGPHPTTVTLHGDALALSSPPSVQQLATLEATIARQPYVAREYGPVSWLRARFASIGRSVAAHTSKRAPRRDLLVRASATGGLNLNDQELTSTLLFGTGVAPVSGVRWLVPSANAIRIFVRSTGSMSQSAINRSLTRLVDSVGPSAVQSVSVTG